MNSISAKIDIDFEVGRFRVQTIRSNAELVEAFRLRYQVFQVEMIGHPQAEGEDRDQFDFDCDHLAIFDSRTQSMVATCRLNCSLFSKSFYTATEFHCDLLLSKPGVKLEIGRVCVAKEFRSGVILMILWKAIAAYMQKTETSVLFGCGSVATESPEDAFLVYRYLQDQKKIRYELEVRPKVLYLSKQFEVLKLQGLQRPKHGLQPEDRERANKLLPPLCKSYLNIGCYVAGTPAFDHDFKCIDFLVILETAQLDARIRQKMMGN